MSPRRRRPGNTGPGHTAWPPPARRRPPDTAVRVWAARIRGPLPRRSPRRLPPEHRRRTRHNPKPATSHVSAETSCPATAACGSARYAGHPVGSCLTSRSSERGRGSDRSDTSSPVAASKFTRSLSGDVTVSRMITGEFAAPGTEHVSAETSNPGAGPRVPGRQNGRTSVCPLHRVPSIAPSCR